MKLNLDNIKIKVSNLTSEKLKCCVYGVWNGWKLKDTICVIISYVIAFLLLIFVDKTFTYALIILIFGICVAIITSSQYGAFALTENKLILIRFKFNKLKLVEEHYFSFKDIDYIKSKKRLDTIYYTVCIKGKKYKFNITPKITGKGFMEQENNYNIFNKIIEDKSLKK